MSGGSSSSQNGSFGENLLALFIVTLFAAIGGFLIDVLQGIKLPKILHKCFGKEISPLIKSFKIPNLLGQIIFGCLARNIFPTIMENYNTVWGTWIRVICLSVILLRGGLELEFGGKGLPVILLTIVPLVFESITAAVLSLATFKMDIALGFSVGFMLSAVSPAVLVPTLMTLMEKGYGVEKGIPVILIAASSFDDILAITLFGLAASISLGEVRTSDKGVGDILLKVFYDILAGIAGALLLGFPQYFTARLSLLLKAVLLLVLSLGAVVFYEIYHFDESKFLFVILFGYICNRFWHNKNPDHYLKSVWTLLKPLLFGSVGALILLNNLKAGDIGYALVIILVSLLIRWLSTFFSVFFKKFTMKERIFMAFSWVPKATVQAALGGVIFDEVSKIPKIDQTARHQEFLDHGNRIITISVLSIILTAPAGAILTMSLGTKYLQKKIMNNTGKNYLENDNKNELVIVNGPAIKKEIDVNNRKIGNGKAINGKVDNGVKNIFEKNYYNEMKKNENKIDENKKKKKKNNKYFITKELEMKILEEHKERVLNKNKYKKKIIEGGNEIIVKKELDSESSSFLNEIGSECIEIHQPNISKIILKK